MFEFIESAAFDRLRAHYLDDDEYSEVQQFMMQNPESGALVRGNVSEPRPSGSGCRRRKGAGQARWFARLIYFVRYQPRLIF